MADTKLSALTELAATPAVDDELYIRDVSEAAADESKRITIANLLSQLPAVTLGGVVTAYAGSGIVRTATKVVAASDADATVKLQADYVCDGTADDVQIQAAIDAVITAGGGTLFLTAGTYNLASGLIVSTKTARVKIQGEGRATILSANDDSITVLTVTSPTRTEADYWGGHTFEDFNIFGVAGGAPGGDAILVDYSKYNNFSNISIGGSRRYGVNLNNWARYNLFIGCEIVGGTNGVIIQSSAAIADTPSNDNKFVACNQIRSSGGQAILIKSAGAASSNLFEACEISNQANSHVIQFGDDSAITIKRNSITNCKLQNYKTDLTDNTYDGIYMLANQYGAFVGNTFYGAGSSNRLRYAINPSTNANNNRIWISPSEYVVATYPNLNNTNSQPHEDCLSLSVMLEINQVKVIGAQGAAVADATDAPSVILRLNELLARCRAHGLIAP